MSKFCKCFYKTDDLPFAKFARSFKSILREQNHAFALRTHICARALQRVNARDFDNGVPLFHRAQRAEPSTHGKPQATVRRGFREPSLEKVKITLLTFSPYAA